MLHLDWTLETSEQRNQHVKKLLETYKPSSSEIETLSRYILYGKDKSDHTTKLPTFWSDDSKVESLDALIESPTFRENSIGGPPLKTPHFKLDRMEIESKAPTALKPAFEELWRQIDETELTLNLYEVRTGKRTQEPRASLRHRVGANTEFQLVERANSMTPYTYTRLKRQLVELRREQYTLKDSYTQVIPSFESWGPEADPLPIWGEELRLEPLNAPIGSPFWVEYPAPNLYTEEQLVVLTRILWQKKTGRAFDFQDEVQTDLLTKYLDEIESYVQTDAARDSTIGTLLHAWNFYRRIAHLTDVQDEILTLKVRHWANEDIRAQINTKYNKTYGTNYISTLYKNALKKIGDAAARHRLILENVFWPENFKTCLDCGKTLLRDSENFVRKSRNNDGFECRCKECTKLKRKKTT